MSLPESSQSRLWLWALAARPKTLTAAVIPVLVGTAVAYAEKARASSSLELSTEDAGALPVWLSLVAFLCATAIQIGTNFFNDAFDSQKGADGAARLGPVRVTSQGLLSGAEVTKAGWLCFLVALLLGAVLVYHGGLVILLIGICALAFGYLYTGGPYPLAYNGLGDLFVLLFFGIVAVSGTTFLLTGHFPADALIAGIQVGLLAVTLIAINNLRDIEGDRAVDKRTLAVMLGERGARVEIVFTLFAPFLLGLFWYGTAFYAFVLPLLAIPLAVHLAISVWCTRPSQAYNSFLARAALLHVLFGTLLAVGFLIDT